MSILEEIDVELRMGEQAKQAGNSGRARVCARRAVGKALEHYYTRMGKDPGKDVMKLLEQFALEGQAPPDVGDAVFRLRQRVRPDFSSEAEEPVEDARLIIRYVLETDHGNPH